ncbi:MAG TPA: transporter substrate-binding domain-containing protein [Stellaceae bacterium]|jgi:polar amino acid transport system substrate-binding protein|nr:transporter substrate-binding domain-containing protein [Stellaceae bacterium]
MSRLLGAFCGFLLLLLGGHGTAHAADPVGEALDQVIAAARADAVGDCAAPNDRLVAILCTGRLRVGVRRDYPQFSMLGQDEAHGFEIEIARAIAKKLGVKVEFTGVTAANRIPLLAEGQIDLVIAAMGHTVERGRQIDFVRPHYFLSETIIVGRRDLPIAGWSDVVGRTVCVTVGNFTNTELIHRHARLLLFEDPVQLVDQLRFETCSLVAQDDSFFAAYFADPDFAQHYESKLHFSPLPWGIGVAHQGGEKLELALSLLSQIFHRDGVFLAMARENHVPTGFLEAQQKLWSTADCDQPDGWQRPGCLMEPPNNVLAPTSFADRVTAFENLIHDYSGIAISLPMLKTEDAFSLLRSGIVNSLILVVGALAATVAVAFVVGAMLSVRNVVLRGAVRALVILVQSSPIVLLLFLAFIITSSAVQYSALVALFASIVALGLYNGCYAGQAIAEAMATLRLETAGEPVHYGRAIRRSTTQIMAFLVNATKGSAIASMIGAPELLNTLTDITSFSSERATTYTVLLIFYSALVGAVVWLTNLARRAYERRGLAA